MNEENKEIIVGWKDSMDVASSCWGSIHASITDGMLLVAYRKLEPSFYQIIVSYNENTGMFMIGTTTQGYSSYIPAATLEYVEKLIIPDMIEHKVDKKTLEGFNQILEIFRTHETTSD